ncbi:hypothetical protein BOX15_Mlig016452g7 [Macrostomum lignano]|uniref:RNA-directed DNA polymerase n=1 Tax=Macrostomum lignano TaxID=282301 RepID=A0A267G0A4_9PLAT|nr:hypothetical protein BOX15_Mlig016452g7 [Macrostomum lignano]
MQHGGSGAGSKHPYNLRSQDGALGEGSEDNAEEASGIQDSATLEGANLMETMKMLLTHQSQQLQEMTRAQERQSAFYLEQLARQQAEFTKLLAESKPRPQAAEPKLFKLTDSDDIEAFLMTFERAAASCGWQKSEWTIRLAPLLTGVAQSAFHSLTTAASADYDLAKATILARYNIGEETYRQRFRSLRKAPEETFQVFATKLEDLFVRWMTAGLDEDQREELISGDSIVRQKVLLEQFTDSLTRGLQVWMRERKPKDIKEAAKLADDYAMARNSDKVGGTPGHPSQETSEGATASNAMDKQRTIQRPQSLKPKISCFNCGGPHKKFQCTNKPANVHLASEERAMDAASGRFITGHADGKELRFLMDTGADRTTIRRSCLPENINWTGHHALLRCFGGDLHRLPIAKVELHLKGYNRTTEVCVADSLPVSALVGLDLISQLKLGGGDAPSTVLGRETREGVHGQPLSANEREGVGAPHRPMPQSEGDERLFAEGIVASGLNQIDPEPAGKTKSRITRAQARKQRQEYNKTRQETAMRPITLDYEAALQDDKELQAAVQTNDLVKESRGRLFRHQAAGEDQLVLPKALRATALSQAHESAFAGHLGTRKTCQRLEQRFWWPTMTKDVKDFVATCDKCQKTARVPGNHKVPLVQVPGVEEAFTKVIIDISGPYTRTASGHQYILSIIDAATRFPEGVPLRKIDAESVAKALVDCFVRTGFPREIQSDKGTNFSSALLQALYRCTGVEGIQSTPYHPQSQALVERFHGTLKNMLRRLPAREKKKWDQYLPYLLFAIREVPNETTGFSPFELLYGRTVRGPLDLLRQTWDEQLSEEKKDIISFVLAQRDRLRAGQEAARNSEELARKRQKLWYDRQSRERELQPGDKVLLLLPSSSKKLHAEWRGPYEVLERCSDVNYRIRMGPATNTFHVNLLKKYNSREAVLMQLPAAATSAPELSEHLTPAERDRLLQLVQDFAGVFSEIPGRTDLVEHRIRTTSDRVVRIRPRREPQAHRQVLQEEIQRMLDLGVIEPSDSDYCSPVCLVAKKDGSVRFTVNFKALNELVAFDSYPMKNIEDLLERVAKAKFISKLDCCKGYWQIPLYEDSKRLTAFAACGKLYQFTVMPMGLNCSSATYQRLMDKLFQGLDNADSYIDDIAVFSATFEQHVEDLREVFGRLKAAGLTVQPRKCYLGGNSADYLGFKLGGGEIGTSEDRVRTITALAQPRTKAQLRSVLGVLNHYRRFVPDYSEKVAALTDLTKKSAPDDLTAAWGEQQTRAFETVKSLLASEPVLRAPDYSRQFTLETDSSETGIGAVLTQEFEDGIHPVLFVSRRLTSAERSYATIEKECLAVRWAVEKLRHYLLGRRFVIKSDHKPLQYLQMDHANPRLQRWAFYLSGYDYEIQYQPGESNTVADGLSRIWASDRPSDLVTDQVI